jgi:hypothetical protein
MQPMSRYKTTFLLAANWILMLALASIVFNGISHGTGDIPVLAKQIIVALSCSLTGFLLLPAEHRNCYTSRYLALWSLLVGAGCFLLMTPYYSDLGHLQAGLRLAIGVFILVFLLCSLFMLLHAIRLDKATALLLVTLLAAACSTAPLWLGPLAELHAKNQLTVDAIISISPLSYLAVLADYDYLRSSWFYRHTPFGSLRYNYPSTLTLTLVYLSMAGMLMTARWRLLRRHSQQAVECPGISS